jgi:prepilin-type N-terminal cleavage/methylation domain-containing protein
VRKLKFRSNHTGFTLVEALVTLAIMGVLALAGATLFTSQLKSQLSVETKAEAIEMERVITSLLMNKGACTATLVGKKIGDPLTELKSATGAVIYKLNAPVGSKYVAIKSMNTTLTAAVAADASLIDLNIAVENLKPGLVALKPLKIPLTVNTAAGIITACFTDKDSLAQQTCESMGGKLSGTNCLFPSCPAGYYMKSLGASGKPECVLSGVGKSCSSGFYLRGYDSNGNALCERLQASNPNPQPTPSSQPNPNPAPSATPKGGSDCQAGSVSWKDPKSGGSCTAQAATGKDGQTTSVSDDESGNTTGSATMKCTGGYWLPQGDAKCTAGCQASDISIGACRVKVSMIFGVGGSRVYFQSSEISGPAGSSIGVSCSGVGQVQFLEYQCGALKSP